MVTSTSAHKNAAVISRPWDTRASVRVSLETYDLGLEGGRFDKDPSWAHDSYSAILLHPMLTGITAEQKRFVTGTQLIDFLLKTTKFEVNYVNEAARNIALDGYPIRFPEPLRLEALQIYTDEGYHAYFSPKISEQILSYYLIDDDLSRFNHNFFTSLDFVGAQTPVNLSFLNLLGCVIVSEAIISKDISREMEGIVYEPVRLMLRNHMVDEAAHGRYFLKVLEFVWSELNDQERVTLGQIIHEAIGLFGKPRTEIYHYSLGRMGFSADEIDRMREEVYGTREWAVIKVRAKMSALLQTLNSLGAFDYPDTYHRFSASGYI
jgi:hypothetical protein